LFDIVIAWLYKESYATKLDLLGALILFAMRLFLQIFVDTRVEGLIYCSVIC